MDEVEMQDPFSERTLVPAERAAAAIELAGRGIRAIPMVEALFNGEARKEWGSH